MAIEKKLICFARLEEFERQLAAGNILDYSIVFIQDAKKIYNRGTYYDCSGISLEQGDERYLRKITEEGMTVSGIDQIRNPSSGMTYAFSDSGNGNEDGIILTSDITKTINGQSLLGVGDITIEGGSADNVYITDFTVNDLLSIAGQPAAIQSDVPRLYDAVVAHKLILVPYDTDEGCHGYGVAVGYYEDMIYLTVLLGAELIELELNHDIDEIGGEQVTLRSWYDKQDRLVSGTNIKTINGTSILGSGNIEIESGGEANVKSDWLETNSDSDSYVKNRTHYVAGTKITSAGSYSIGASTPIYYREKVYNLEIGVRTQIDSNASGVYVTLNNGGILLVESFGNYLETFPIIAVSGVVPLDDMFIPETIVRKDEAILKDVNGNLVTAHAQALYGGGLVYALPDQANGDEDDIIATKNTLKTINGESIVGSGNIVISGGSGGSGAYSEVNHGTSDTTFTLTPNTFHVWDEVASLTLDFGSETSGVANEFLFQFTSGSTATSLTLPDDIKWANDEAPTIEANMIYQVSVLKGLASVLEFSNVSLISFILNGITYSALQGMTWADWCNSNYNTIGAYVSGNYIYAGAGGITYNNAAVSPSEVIINNRQYTIAT